MFGYQFLNGCNPCVIERCDELPINFPVSDEMVAKFLDRGMTLAEEIKVSIAQKKETKSKQTITPQ